MPQVYLAHLQTIGIAPRLYHQVTQILATARRLNLAHDQVFDTAIPLHLQHEQVFYGMTQVALAFEHVFTGYGAKVAIEFIQSWATHEYNIAYIPFVQLIGSRLGRELQDIQFSVTVAGVRVGVSNCDFDRSGFASVASITLARRSDWINKDIGDNVIITILGEQYSLIVVNKLWSEQNGMESSEIAYYLECMSITAQLSEGINQDISASRISKTFPSGVLATEALDFLTSGVCSYSLNVADFKIGSFVFEDEERFSAIRKILPEDYGWIIETDKNGTLQINVWKTPVPNDEKKILTFQNKSIEPPSENLYSRVVIRNFIQREGAGGLSLEVIDNGDGTGFIHGYSVPWDNGFNIYDSEDSLAPSIVITGGDIEEPEIIDNDLEFSNYTSRLSKPCYNLKSINWGKNDNLSPVTYTEGGELKTGEDPGYSVAVSATYITRRKKWYYENRKTDITQVRLKYDAAN